MRPSPPDPRIGVSQSSRAHWVSSIVRALDDRGIDGLALAETCGIDADHLADPANRIPAGQGARLWLAAIEAAATPSFGLAVAEQMSRRGFGSLGEAVCTAHTGLEALEQVAQRVSLISDAVVATVCVESTRVRASCDIVAQADRLFPPESLDTAAAAWLLAVRLIYAPRTIDPLAVTLTRPTPPDPTPFEQLFRAPIAFESQRCTLEFRRDDLLLPTRFSDRLRSRKAYHAARQEMPSWEARVRDHVANHLAGGPPDQASVARELGVSRSLLQLRLAERGTSFREIVRDTRLTLARAHLEEGRLPFDAIAHRLGFAHGSAFSRAFKEWTGMSPRDYAAQAKAPGGA